MRGVRGEIEVRKARTNGHDLAPSIFSSIRLALVTERIQKQFFIRLHSDDSFIFPHVSADQICACFPARVTFGEYQQIVFTGLPRVLYMRLKNGARGSPSPGTANWVCWDSAHRPSPPLSLLQPRYLVSFYPKPFFF